jgi:hypothetical protein
VVLAEAVNPLGTILTMGMIWEESEMLVKPTDLSKTFGKLIKVSSHYIFVSV